MANRGLAAKQVLYLYGISEVADSKPAKLASPGIDGEHPVQAIRCGNFLCWVCAVDGEGFAAEINRNMENLEWLALHGVRHQQVVAEIASRSTMIPARFGTIFSGDQALSQDVQERSSALKKVFKRISGADEWGVKVFAEPRPAPQMPPTIRSGKDYLRAKAARLKSHPDRDDSGLKEFASALKKIATNAAPTGKISGGQPDLVWQATFLVPRARRKQWDQAFKRYVTQWRGSRRIEVNGPWPPYSFVSDAE